MGHYIGGLSVLPALVLQKVPSGTYSNSVQPLLLVLGKHWPNATQRRQGQAIEQCVHWLPVPWPWPFQVWQESGPEHWRGRARDGTGSNFAAGS